MGKKSKLRKRSNRNKVSALDVFEEFESESSNFFVEAKSKLSAEEQRTIRENYIKAERQHLGIGLKGRFHKSSNPDADECPEQDPILDRPSKLSESSLKNALETLNKDTHFADLDDSKPLDELGNIKGANEIGKENGKPSKNSYIREHLGNKLGENFIHTEPKPLETNIDPYNSSIASESNNSIGNNKGSIREQNEHKEERKDVEIEHILGNNKGSNLRSEIEIERNSHQKDQIQKVIVINQNQESIKQGAIREQVIPETPSSESNKNNLKGNKKGTEILNKTPRPLIREQLGSKNGTIREQWDNKSGAPREQLEIKKGPNKGTQSGAIGEQFDSIAFNSNIHLLVGNEKRFIDYLFLKCLSLGSFDSGPLTLDELTSKLHMNSEVLKMVIKRLCKKQYILRSGGKRGKGGFTQFSIGKELYQKMLLDRELQRRDLSEISDREQLGNNWGPKKGTIKGTNPPSSSSYNSINTNTTEATQNSEVKPVSQDLPLEWAEIHTPDNLKEIGFGQTQVQQLYRLGKITASDVQSSLDAFSYDLETGGVRSKGSKLGLLMGVLRNSGAYISEGMIAEIKAQVESNERRRKELEELDKRQAQEQLAEKAQKILGQMSPSEKLKLIPVSHLFKEGSPVHERLLIAKIIEGLSENQ